MANTTVLMRLPTSGLTTATLVLYNSTDFTTANGTPDTLAALGDTGALYSATVTEALDGVYYGEAFQGGQVIASGWYRLQDDTGTYGVLSSLVDTELEAGGSNVTLTINDDDTNPIADAEVWITSDSDGDTVVQGTKRTDTNGQVTFLLDDGISYYAWRQKSGYNFTNPVQFTAVAD